jgi:hypothetical protein
LRPGRCLPGQSLARPRRALVEEQVPFKSYSNVDVVKWDTNYQDEGGHVNPILLEVNRLAGLPAHPLLVHGAVVIVPLAAIAFLVTGARDAWRRLYYLPVTLTAIIGGIFAFLAKESGEPLSESVRRAGQRVGEHPEQGDTAFLFAMLFAAACAAVYFFFRYEGRIRSALRIQQWPRLPVSYNTALYLAAVPLALLAIFTMVVAGHSGAELVWKTNAG